MSLKDEVTELALQMEVSGILKRIYAEREKILEAFLAQHPETPPDEIVQIESVNSAGLTTYWVRRKKDDALIASLDAQLARAKKMAEAMDKLVKVMPRLISAADDGVEDKSAARLARVTLSAAIATLTAYRAGGEE